MPPDGMDDGNGNTDMDGDMNGGMDDGNGGTDNGGTDGDMDDEEGNGNGDEITNLAKLGPWAEQPRRLFLLDRTFTSQATHNNVNLQPSGTRPSGSGTFHWAGHITGGGNQSRPYDYPSGNQAGA